MKKKTKKPEGKGWVWDDESGRWFRVRKLTPKECFRLMGVCDSDIDKLMSVDEQGKQIIANSQLYKMAGNSIVVQCMEGIFRNLFFGGEAQVEKDGQVRLF